MDSLLSERSEWQSNRKEESFEEEIVLLHATSVTLIDTESSEDDVDIKILFDDTKVETFDATDKGTPLISLKLLDCNRVITGMILLTIRGSQYNFFFLLGVLSGVSLCLSSVPFHFLTARPLGFLKTGFSCVEPKISEVKKIILLFFRKGNSFLFFFAFPFVFF